MSSTFEEKGAVAPTGFYILPCVWRSAIDNHIQHPIIHCWGYTATGKSVYVRIAHQHSSIESYTDELGLHISGTSRDRGSAEMELPASELSKFWYARNIQPYQWFMIQNSRPLRTTDGNSEVQLFAFETEIFRVDDELADMLSSELDRSNEETTDGKPRILFWDSEVFSKTPDFPTAETDPIAMISAVTENGAVLITTCNVDAGRLDDEYEQGNLQVVKTETEAGLIQAFYHLLENYNADRLVDFNGDSFDWQYVLRRGQLLGVPLPHAVRAPSIGTRRYQMHAVTPFGFEMYNAVSIPGVENTDLLPYFRRYYPWFPNHRLQTVTERFLGVGKEDVSIEQLRAAIAADDPDMLAPVALYSMIDSYRLFELWRDAGVDVQLKRACNGLRCSTNDLLRRSFSHLIKQMAVNVNPAFINVSGKDHEASHLMEPDQGIYTEVYHLEYHRVYLEIMRKQVDSMIKVMADNSVDAPPELVYRLFHSKYNDRYDQCKAELELWISDLKQRDVGLIAVEPLLLRVTDRPLSGGIPYVDLVEHIRSFAQLTKSSYLYVDDHNELNSKGRARLALPPFVLAADAIRDYLMFAIGKVEKPELTFTMPDVNATDKRKLLLTVKLLPEPKGPLKEEITKQHLARGGNPVRTWLNVDYIMTPQGPLIVDEKTDLETQQFDYGWYANEMKKTVDVLSVIPFRSA